MSLTINTCELGIKPPFKLLWQLAPFKRPRHHTVNLRRHKNNPSQRICPQNDIIGVLARPVDGPSTGLRQSLEPLASCVIARRVRQNTSQRASEPITALDCALYSRPCKSVSSNKQPWGQNPTLSCSRLSGYRHGSTRWRPRDDIPATRRSVVFRLNISACI